MIPRCAALISLLLTTAAALAQAQLEITLEQFGVGSAYRPGDHPVGIRVELTSNLSEAMPVWVHWRLPDADGEIVSFGRSLTLTPGRPTPVWLYAPLPASFDATMVSLVQVFEERDGQLGNELGVMRFSPRDAAGQPQPIDVDKGLIAVVGRAPVGLDGYRSQGSSASQPDAAHEDTRIISGISPGELPDRWYPLKSFEAIVWGPDASPQELRVDAAAALRSYVERGGHLVIILPQAGDPWGWGAADNPANRKTELDDLLPRREPRRDQAVPLADLIPIMSKSRRVPISGLGKPIRFEMGIRVFKELKGAFDAVNTPWQPHQALVDGRVVSIQRSFGHGRITIIGVDVGYGQLTSTGLPQTDIFWNRVLGRRADTPTSTELRDIEAAKPSRLASQVGAKQIDLGSGRLFEDRISMPGAAGVALLFAIVFFIIYLGAAGPGGYHALKAYKLVQHAWLAFIAAAIFFTFIALGSVRLLRDNNVKISHITYLDHVAQPAHEVGGGAAPRQLQRAVSWLSIYLPSFGAQRVSIDSFESERDLLLSWHAPQRQADDRFPNADRYRINMAEDAADYVVPGRATAKQFYAHYLGPPESGFGEMFSVDPNNPLRAEMNPLTFEVELKGSIIHHLVGNLRNVRIIWIKDVRPTPSLYVQSNQRELPWVAADTERLLNTGELWALGVGDNELAPGQWYSLERMRPGPGSRTRLSDNIDDRYLDPYRRDRITTSVDMPMDEADRRRYREILCFFQQLTPPKYLVDPNGTQPDNVYAHRHLGRELDASVWFTRPCVIILGELEPSPCPIPIRVNGEAPGESSGLTIVRWFYPLELDEKEVIPFDSSGSTIPVEPAAPPGAENAEE